MKWLVIIFLAFTTLQVFARTTSFYSGGRFYRFVTPAQSSQKRPLLVVLHGCQQNSEIMMKGTQLEAEAMMRDFYLLFPEQSHLINPTGCWNWFYSEQQKRSPLTEMGGIVATIKAIIKSENIDTGRIYVSGLSAGGALTHALSVCYPDVFKGAAVHSGFVFKAAENFQEGSNILKNPNPKGLNYLASKARDCAGNVERRLDTLLIIQGEDDPHVRPIQAQVLSASNWIMRGETFKETQSKVLYPNGYSILETKKQSATFVERTYLVKGLKHAWGTNVSGMDYFDPYAPSSTELILKAFDL